MSTFFQSKEDAVKSRKWLIVNAENKTLGRLSSQVAHLLRGKHKPEYTPHTDCGDFVVIVNAAKIKLTGKKLSDKIYYTHTGYMGHMNSISAGELLRKNPTKLLTEAVTGMLPKGPLGKAMAKKLKVYADDKHIHSAQRPVDIQLKGEIGSSKN
jgi:large subunit ribosomal protein L13